MILEDDDISQADVYISPPNDGICSDEDSGDENDGIVDNLTGNQLRASAEVVASYVDGHQERISSNEDCNANDYEDGNDTESSEEALPPPSKKVRCSAKPSPRVRDWTTKDIPSNLATQKPWPTITTPKFLRAHQTPTTLFELFFDDELVDFIVTNTNNYARHDIRLLPMLTRSEHFLQFFSFQDTILCPGVRCTGRPIQTLTMKQLPHL